MRNKSIYKKNIIQLVTLYLRYRNSYNIGFQKYSYFKNLMKYITKNESNIFLRRIFEHLTTHDIIEKKIILGSVRYRFNPNNKIDDPNKKIIISFN